MAKHVTEKPILHEIFVIGCDTKGSHFTKEFVELEQGTKILVDVDLKFKGKMKISSLFGNKSFKEDYSKILDDFLKISEN